MRYAYRKLGRRYPRIAMAVQFQLAHVVVLGGVGLLRLYQSMSTAALVAIIAGTQVLLAIENAYGLRAAFRLVQPADPWLRGERTPETALAAWRALAGLPFDYLRSRQAAAVLANLLPVSIFVTLMLPVAFFPAVIAVAAGAAIVLLYGVLLRFFALELILRPVLEVVSRDLPEGAQLGKATVPLKWRLLLALPAINIITGVVVTGLSHRHAGLSAFGFGVLVTIAVAFTISFELSVLLLRSILEPISDLRRGTERAAAGDLSVRVPVLGTDEIGQLTGSFNNMVAGLEEREKLREAFGAFVDPVLADRVLAEGTILEGDDVEVTVLFVDIRDFTTFAERASAREVVGQLNDFYELIVPVLAKHGGHANKFVGDGLLGVFGAPDLVPDHADRAVAAALEIAATVRATYGQRLRIGVGVNSGPVMAGTIGGGGRVEFTVIGDPVNTAARVERVTRETGDAVLITEATRCLLTRDFGGFDERPTVDLKGKTERVRLHAPLAVGAGEAQPAALQEALRATSID